MTRRQAFFLILLTDVLLLVCGLTLAVSWFYKKQPVAPEEISSQLENDPVQTATSSSPFTFDYEGQSYEIEPKADYEIYGLIVTQNDISSIFDMYHTKKSVDVKDLCLIWGDNVVDDLYHRLQFWSDPWTCWMHTESREDYDQFRSDQLSNNHILVADDELRNKVNSLHNGDQVFMRGTLVNYHYSDDPTRKRESSLVRTDTGQGACEVLFLEDLTVIKRGNSGWHTLYRISMWVVIGAALAKITMFLFMPLGLYQKRRW